MKILLTFCFIFTFYQIIAQNYKILNKWDYVARNIDIDCKEIDSLKNSNDSTKKYSDLTLPYRLGYIFTELTNKAKDELVYVEFVDIKKSYIKEIYYIKNKQVIKFIKVFSNEEKASIYNYYYFKDGKQIKKIGNKLNIDEIERIKKLSKYKLTN